MCVGNNIGINLQESYYKACQVVNNFMNNGVSKFSWKMATSNFPNLARVAIFDMDPHV